jgi:hypothetical protein
MVEAVVGMYWLRRYGCRTTLCYTVRYLVCIHRPAIFNLVVMPILHLFSGSWEHLYGQKRLFWFDLNADFT